MKPLARIAAVLSFGFFLFPGAWVLSRTTTAAAEPFAVIVGCVLVGIAFFVGPMLWLAGDKCGPKPDAK